MQVQPLEKEKDWWQNAEIIMKNIYAAVRENSNLRAEIDKMKKEQKDLDDLIQGILR